MSNMNRTVMAGIATLGIGAGVAVWLVVNRPNSLRVAVGATAITSSTTTSTPGPTSTTSSTVAPDCTIAADHTDTSDKSVQDNPPDFQGGGEATTGGSPVPGSTKELVADYTAIAAVHVVGRDLPHERPYGAAIGSFDANQPTLQDPAMASAEQNGPPEVSRVVRVATDRAIKGSVAHCLAIDIPGGVANGHQTTNANYPPVIRIGDRLLVFFSPLGPPGHRQVEPDDIAAVAPDGTVVVPFGGHETVNVDTWQPPT